MVYMKKSLAVVALVATLLIGGYVFYKRCVVNKYIYENETYNNFVDALDKRSFMKIESKEPVSDDYISMGKISLKNDFQDFVRVDQGNNSLIGEKYVLYSDSGTFVAGINFGRDYLGKVEMIKSQDIVGKKTWRTAYLKELGIKSDLELLEYVISIKDKKYNFFNSIREIKGDYEIKRILSSYALGDEVTIFTGDLDGYMTSINDKTREAFVFKNGVGYYITFMGLDYFNNDRIKDVLENLVIKD